MQRLFAYLLAIRHEERGATAVEYGMLVALIAAVIVAVVVVLGEQIRDAFDAISGELGGGDAPAE
jgi:pilus assembly protein Flp/PilA